MLDPHQLNVFLTAAETLNFSRAAERLHMSQPSVTQHIRSLEQHFGAPLFERRGRQVALTEAGLALIPLARQMIAVTLRTDEIMDQIKGEVQGNLIIGCSTTPGKYILPVLLADFMRRHPRVNATCNVSSRTQALQMLEHGEVNFALSSNPEEFSSLIEFRKLLDDPICLLVPKNHEWAARGQIRLEELPKERFIMREETAGTYRMVRSALARLGVNIRDLRIILTLGNSEAIAIAIQEGLGVGFVSQMVVERMPSERTAVVKIEAVDLFQEIFIGRNRRHSEGRLQATFWDYLNNQAQPVIQRLQESR
jgi:DNA-binding transcriptional LysR family regulator